MNTLPVQSGCPPSLEKLQLPAIEAFMISVETRFHYAKPEAIDKSGNSKLLIVGSRSCYLIDCCAAAAANRSSPLQLCRDIVAEHCQRQIRDRSDLRTHGCGN